MSFIEGPTAKRSL